MEFHHDLIIIICASSLRLILVFVHFHICESQEHDVMSVLSNHHICISLSIIPPYLRSWRTRPDYVLIANYSNSTSTTQSPKLEAFATSSGLNTRLSYWFENECYYKFIAVRRQHTLFNVDVRSYSYRT